MHDFCGEFDEKFKATPNESEGSTIPHISRYDLKKKKNKETTQRMGNNQLTGQMKAIN